MAQKFTRSEFYDLVWSKPLTRLAKEFGVSDVALHKLCRKHDIPKPATGSRAKIAAGKMVERPPLPALKTGVSDIVCISGIALRTERETITTIRDEATSRASKFDPKSDVKEHPLVARSMAKLRKAKPTDQGLVHLAQAGLIDIGIAPSSIDRIELALNRIVAAAQVQGFALVQDEKRLAFTDGQISVPFRLKETVSRTKHEPTAKELAKEEEERKKGERRRERAGLGTSSNREAWRRRPSWDYVPSGDVSLEFDLYIPHYPSIRRSFKDGKNQRLEDMANDIAVGLAALAVAKADDERRAAHEKVRAEENSMRRMEQRRLAYIEERRSAVLEKILDKYERSDRLRRLIAATSNDPARSRSHRTIAFQDWLGKQLASAEQEANAIALDHLLEAEDLFGDNDDKGFVPDRHRK